jgi:hypothetical protein
MVAIAWGGALALGRGYVGSSPVTVTGTCGRFNLPAAATTHASSGWKMSLCAPEGRVACFDHAGGIDVEDGPIFERVGRPHLTQRLQV